MSFKIGKDQNDSLIKKSESIYKNNIAFKGIIPASTVNASFNMLQTSEIIGPALVDVVSMIIPRTYIDYTRGHEAGNETLRREFSSTINVFLPSIYALGLGGLINFFSKNKIPNLAIDSDTIDILKDAWKAPGKTISNYESTFKGTKSHSQIYVENILDKVRGSVGEESTSFTKIAKRKIAKRIAKLANNDLSGKVLRDEINSITKYAIKKLKAAKHITISSGEKSVVTDMKKLINHIYKMDKKVFQKVPADQLDNVIKQTRNLSKTKSFLGLGIALGLGFVTQPLNRYFTSLKTGSNAFVGLPDYEKTIKKKQKEKKEGGGKLLLAKIASAVLMAYFTTASITKKINPIETFKAVKNFSGFLQKVECKSLFPTLNQIKVLYGVTIIGRMFAANDKNELRETNIRDLSGFFNWIILGEVVAGLTTFTLAAKAIKQGKLKSLYQVFNKKTIKNMPENSIKKIWYIISKLNKKTHAEIEALNLGKKVTNKIKKISNKGTATGLTYSGLALGLFVPLFNKRITNKAASKKGADSKPKGLPAAGCFEYNKKIVEITLGSLTNNQPQKSVVSAEEQPEQVYIDEFEFNKKIAEITLGDLSR